MDCIDHTPRSEPPAPPAIDPDAPDLIGLPEAARLAGVHHSTLHLWTFAGRMGLVLPTVRIGREIRTTRQAVQWFVAESAKRPARRGPGRRKPRR